MCPSSILGTDLHGISRRDVLVGKMSDARSINNEPIRVKISLMLPPVAGIEKTELDIDLEKGEITEVFEKLYSIYPQLDPDSPEADLTLSNVYWISLNGIMINFSHDGNPPLKMGDELAIMMPLAGG